MKVPKDKPIENIPEAPAPATKPSVKKIKGLAKQSIQPLPKAKGSHTFTAIRKDIDRDLRRLLGMKPQRRR